MRRRSGSEPATARSALTFRIVLASVGLVVWGAAAVVFALGRLAGAFVVVAAAGAVIAVVDLVVVASSQGLRRAGLIQVDPGSTPQPLPSDRALTSGRPLPGLPARVTVYEVGVRDGLQNEKAVVPVDVKAELVRRLVAAGPRTSR